MKTKDIIHDEIMYCLDEYLNNTPKDVIKSEIEDINNKKFSGTTASDYFSNFHKYYSGTE